MCQCPKNPPCLPGVVWPKGNKMTVYIENAPVAKVGDNPAACGGCKCLPPPKTYKITTGCSKILVQNSPMANTESVIIPKCPKMTSRVKKTYIGF